MLLERTATSPCLLPADGPSVGAELEVAFVDPLSNPQWNRWVQSHPDGSVFHTSAWAKVLVKTYGHKPFYLRFSRGRQTVALIPLMEVSSFLTGRRAVCVPFSDSCAPLIFDTDAAPAIMEALSRLASEKKWRHVELRGPVRTDGAAPSTEFLGHTLAVTDDSEALFSRFSSANRGAIRKAQKSGVTSHISTSRDAIRDFYRLHTVTRKRHGVPPQPLSFFLNIHEEIIKKGMGFVVTAWNDTTAIAANVYFRFADRAIYKFGASDTHYQHLRGSNAVMWKALEFLAGSGVKALDFGRTSQHNEGLRQYKLSWGASEETLAYYKFDTATRSWATSPDRASGILNRVLSTFPVPVNRLAGALIYPHLD